MSESRGAAGFEPTESVALGRTSVEVTRLGIGTNPLAGLMERVPHEFAVATVEAAWDEGVRFFDMAPLYGYGFAERFVGEVLRERGFPDDFVHDVMAHASHTGVPRENDCARWLIPIPVFPAITAAG